MSEKYSSYCDVSEIQNIVLYSSNCEKLATIWPGTIRSDLAQINNFLPKYNYYVEQIQIHCTILCGKRYLSNSI